MNKTFRQATVSPRTKIAKVPRYRPGNHKIQKIGQDMLQGVLNSTRLCKATSTSRLSTSGLIGTTRTTRAIWTSRNCASHTIPRVIMASSQEHSTPATGELFGDKNTPESEWKNRLTAQEYHVIRQKGTEAPGTGEYNNFKAPPEGGTFVCRACNAPLYDSSTKFNSGCGWPAFYDELPGTVERHEDVSLGMRRVEITCKNCGGHLGHVFEGEGFNTPTDQRHCVNSLSIKFVKRS